MALLLGDSVLLEKYLGQRLFERLLFLIELSYIAAFHLVCQFQVSFSLRKSRVLHALKVLLQLNVRLTVQK